MIRFICAFLVLVISSVAAAAEPVHVHIKWEYKDFPAKIEVYDVKGKRRLWETKSVPAAELPAEKLLQDASFVLPAGAVKRFVLVVRNESHKKLFFFAAPHTVHPVEHSLGFKFKCLCINHAYSVEPGQAWYRIVEFRLDPHFEGADFDVTHTIIGIDEVRARAFSKNPSTPDAE